MPPYGLDPIYGQNNNNLDPQNPPNNSGVNPNTPPSNIPPSNVPPPADQNFQQPAPEQNQFQANPPSPSSDSIQPPANSTNYGQPSSPYNYSDIQFQPEQQQQSGGGGKGLVIFLVIMLIIVFAASAIIFGTSRGYFSVGLEKIWPAIAPEQKIQTQSPSATTSNNNLGDADLAKQRDTQRKQDLQAIKIALKNYKNDTGSYPIADTDENLGAQNNKLQVALVPKYIKALPKDPKDPQYYYTYKSNGDTFTLTCVLENTQDSEGKLIGNLRIYTLSSTTDSTQ